MPPRISRQQEELFLKHVEEKLKIKDWTGWYNVNSKDLFQFSLGVELVRKYGPWKVEKNEQGNAVANMLKVLRPEHPWDFSKFKSPLFGRQGYWKSAENQRKFLESLAKDLNIKSLDDWYNIPVTQFMQYGGRGLLRNRTMYSLLQSVYPEHKFKFWKFKSLVDEMWKEESLQRAFLDDCEKELGITTKSGWYNIKPKDISRQGGAKLLQMYNNSMYDIVKSVYPGTAQAFLTWIEVEWLPWLFSPVPSDFWKNKDNQYAFMKHVKKKFDIKEMDDFYKLFCMYNIHGCFRNDKVYPNHAWQEEKFLHEPDPFWNTEEAKRSFMEKAEKHFNIKNWTDWYKISQKDFMSFGGGTLLTFYDSSFVKFLSTYYFDKPWDIFKFERLPRNFWDSEGNVKKALEYIAHQLHFKELDDWYSVTSSQISKLGFSQLLAKYGSVHRLLQEYYPQHKWDPEKINKVSKRHWRLFKVLQLLYPQATDIYVNYPHPQLSFTESGTLMELDIYIPSLNLAFEYQGEQHYEEQRVFGALDARKQKDEEKRIACKQLGVKLVEVPHWWNGTKENLEQLINQS